MIGKDIEERTGFFTQSVVELIHEVQPCSDLGQVTCECWEHVGSWSCIKEESED
jgi:hypothetical protein